MTESNVKAYKGCSDEVSGLYVKQVFDLTPFVMKTLDSVSLVIQLLVYFLLASITLISKFQIVTNRNI